MNHTKEPWSLAAEDRYGDTPINADDWHSLALVVTRMDGDKDQCPEGLANARRIVACVNACAGIPTDWLETCAKDQACNPEILEPVIADLSRQLDELLSALISLEQAYSNSHSPQHRSACLIEARAAIAKAEAA